jgi:uncharacterized BrkB/YihY/UPF0761 family membrane protein
MKLANIIFGIIAIAISAFTLNQIGSFPEGVPGEIGADVFPTILAYGLGLLGGLLIISAVFSQSQERAEPFNIKEKSTQRLIIALLATIAYCYALDVLGFITCTSIFLLFMMVLMKERALIKMVIVSGVITYSIFIIFSQFLNIMLPMGTIHGF